MKTTSPSSAEIPSPILCMDTSTRPPGISTLEFMTAKYEQSRGIASSLTRKVEAATSGPTASASTGSTSLYQFIRTGQVSASTTARDMRSMLDLARDLILSYGEQTRAAAPPAPAPPPATTTAAQFEAPPLRMSKSEFDKMTPSGKSKFCISGGKLV